MCINLPQAEEIGSFNHDPEDMQRAGCTILKFDISLVVKVVISKAVPLFTKDDNLSGKVEIQACHPWYGCTRSAARLARNIRQLIRPRQHHSYSRRSSTWSGFCDQPYSTKIEKNSSSHFRISFTLRKSLQTDQLICNLKVLFELTTSVLSKTSRRAQATRS